MSADQSNMYLCDRIHFGRIRTIPNSPIRYNSSTYHRIEIMRLDTDRSVSSLSYIYLLFFVFQLPLKCSIIMFDFCTCYKLCVFLFFFYIYLYYIFIKWYLRYHFEKYSHRIINIKRRNNRRKTNEYRRESESVFSSSFTGNMLERGRQGRKNRWRDRVRDIEKERERER